MTTKLTVAGDDLTVDKLLWRRYGSRGRELVEETLSLNPDIAALGPILPIGTELIIPDLPQSATPTVTVITLFG